MPIVLPIKKQQVKEMIEKYQDNFNENELVLTLLNEENCSH